jgi:hypothetical protein
MAANYPTTGSENSFYLEFDMPQSRTCRTAIADSFSSSFSFSFCIGRGWQQIYPQQVQRTLFIFSSTCRKAEHVEQLEQLVRRGGLILILFLILILYWPGMAANYPTASSENSFYL